MGTCESSLYSSLLENNMNWVTLKKERKALLRILASIRLRSANMPSMLKGFFTSINTSGKPLTKTVMSGRKLSSVRSLRQVNSVVTCHSFLSGCSGLFKLSKSIYRVPLVAVIF